MDNTCEAHIMRKPSQLKRLFNIHIYGSNRYQPGNILNKLYNNLVRAINEEIIFPKIILMVIDCDLHKRINGSTNDVHMVITETIEYLFQQIHKLIMDCKTNLPEKATRFKYPTVLWVLPPDHANFNDNTKRNMVATVLQNEALKINEMRYIRLNLWSFTSNELVTETQTGYRFTSRGLARYWSSIDNAAIKWLETHGNGQMNNRRRPKWLKFSKNFNRK